MSIWFHTWRSYRNGTEFKLIFMIWHMHMRRLRILRIASDTIWNIWWGTFSDMPVQSCIIYNKLESSIKQWKLMIMPCNKFQNTFAISTKRIYSATLKDIPMQFRYIMNTLKTSLKFWTMTYLAECYEKVGEVVMARKYYQEAIELPLSLRPWFGLVLLHLIPEYDDSLIFFRKLSVSMMRIPKMVLAR